MESYVKKTAFIFLIFLYSFLISCSSNNTINRSIASKFPIEEIKSCYRWVGEDELKYWMKGKIKLTKIIHEFKGIGPGTFCWINAVG